MLFIEKYCSCGGDDDNDDDMMILLFLHKTPAIFPPPYQHAPASQQHQI